MNVAPRIVIAALFVIALSTCGPATSVAPDAVYPSPGLTSRDHLAPTEEQQAKRAATAVPAAPTAVPTAPPTVSPTEVPPAPTAPPTAMPTAVPTAVPTEMPPVPTAAPTAVPTEMPPVPTAAPTAPPVEVVGIAAPAAPIEPVLGQIGRGVPDRIIIEAIGLDRSLVQVGLDAANTPVVPDHEVAWYTRSASPGAGENVVVWGHALRFRSNADVPAPLERVREAQIGDQITIVTTDGGVHAYVISEQIWATPDQVRYILPTGSERLTIVNCIGDYVLDASGEVVSMTHRLITIAEPVR